MNRSSFHASNDPDMKNIENPDVSPSLLSAEAGHYICVVVVLTSAPGVPFSALEIHSDSKNGTVLAVRHHKYKSRHPKYHPKYKPRPSKYKSRHPKYMSELLHRHFRVYIGIYSHA